VVADGGDDWSTGLDGGRRKVVREDQCIAGLGPKT
jgi:hypothetical protein